MRLILILFFYNIFFCKEKVALGSNNNNNNNSTCQNFGFYYKNESEANNPENKTCYLCFCTQKATNLCWQTGTTKCNPNTEDHKRNKRFRSRRSPAGIADLFMQGAANDFLNNNPKPVCTPFQSSYSDGCPPDDWCTGCTVCDCNSAGQWDCHLLSYCGTNEKKKKKLDNKIRRRTNKTHRRQKPNENKPKTEATPAKNKEEKLKDMKPSQRQAELNLRKAKRESELRQMLKGVVLKKYANATLADKTLKNMKRSLNFFKAIEKIGDNDNKNTVPNDTDEKSVSKIIIKRYNVNNDYVTVKPPIILFKDIKIVNPDNNVTTIEKRRIKKVYAYVPNKVVASSSFSTHRNDLLPT